MRFGLQGRLAESFVCRWSFSFSFHVPGVIAFVINVSSAFLYSLICKCNAEFVYHDYLRVIHIYYEYLNLILFSFFDFQFCEFLHGLYFCITRTMKFSEIFLLFS